MARVTYTCKVCGHQWHPRKAALPEVCPNRKCHSAYWQEGPQRASRAESLAKAKAKRELEQSVLAKRVPVSQKVREATYYKLGLMHPKDDGLITIGKTNANEWYDAGTEPEEEYPKAGMLDLLSFNKETDVMFVVNEQENSGICLTGDGIYPGDIIHFRKGIQPNNGDIVLAEGFDIEGHWFVTAKHYHVRGLRWNGLPIVELRPSNPRCKVIRVFPQNILEISVEISRTHRNIHKRNSRGRNK